MVFIVGDTLHHQPMVAGHMVVPQFRGPITYCVLQWCHPMLTGTQRRTSCSTRMITLFGDHVIKLDSGPRILNIKGKPCAIYSGADTKILRNL